MYKPYEFIIGPETVLIRSVVLEIIFFLTNIISSFISIGLFFEPLIALSLKGIIFSAMFIEDPIENNKIKISFRSIGEFSCDKFARKHFNGGGHVNAAGGKDFGTIENTINKFNKFLINYKTDLTK